MFLFNHFSHLHSVVDTESLLRGLSTCNIYKVKTSPLEEPNWKFNKIINLESAGTTPSQVFLPWKQELDQFEKVANMRLQATFGMKLSAFSS